MSSEDAGKTGVDKPKVGTPLEYTPALAEDVATLEGSNTLLEIAAHLGVARRTVYQWMERFPEFAHAVKEARGSADDRVVSNLYAQTPKNVVASIFWLKNRRPEEWRDKIEHEVSGQAPVFIFNIGGKREELGAGPKQVEGEVVDVEAEEVDE